MTRHNHVITILKTPFFRKMLHHVKKIFCQAMINNCRRISDSDSTPRFPPKIGKITKTKCTPDKPPIYPSKYFSKVRLGNLASSRKGQILTCSHFYRKYSSPRCSAIQVFSGTSASVGCHQPLMSTPSPRSCRRIGSHFSRSSGGMRL